MSETRYIEEYEQGTGRLLRQIPYEVSDEQVYQEQLARDMNDIHNAAKQVCADAGVALGNWSSLTPAQKDVILKKSVETIRGLIKWALWKDGWLKLGVL